MAKLAQGMLLVICHWLFVDETVGGFATERNEDNEGDREKTRKNTLFFRRWPSWRRECYLSFAIGYLLTKRSADLQQNGTKITKGTERKHAKTPCFSEDGQVGAGNVTCHLPLVIC